MKQGRAGLVLINLVLLVPGLPLCAAEFSQSLSSEEFSAAGLNKLSAEELNRLNALVASRASKERKQAPDGETPGLTASHENSSTSGRVDHVPAPRRVVVNPGTTIEYATMETQLTGSFRGYEPGTILTLANGQRWRVVDGSYWAPAKDAEKVRKAVLEPGVLGSFFLRIDSGGRPKVKFVGNVQ